MKQRPNAAYRFKHYDSDILEEYPTLEATKKNAKKHLADWMQGEDFVGFADFEDGSGRVEARVYTEEHEMTDACVIISD